MPSTRARDRAFLTWWLYSRVPGDGCRYPTEHMDVIDLIRNAFPVQPIPEAATVVEKTYCVEHLHEILAGRPWDEPTVRAYRMCDDGFSLLTVSGLHYYLPGYLIAKIEDPETADVIGEYVTYTLCGTSDFCRTRMAELGKLMNPPSAMRFCHGLIGTRAALRLMPTLSDLVIPSKAGGNHRMQRSGGG